MTHLTMRAWARLAGAKWERVLATLPGDRACCSGRPVYGGEAVVIEVRHEMLPTCPECAVYADAAREMGAAS